MKKYQSIRLFKNPYLEALTHIHPIVPLLMWGPIIAYLFFDAYSSFNLALMDWTWALILGPLLWSGVEYTLHRWLFHYPAKSAWAKRFVYLFHGLHHDDPHDPTRLVMPPAPAIILATPFYLGMKMLFPAGLNQVVFGSFMIGYLAYDYIHYATHHFAMTSKVGRFLRSYHLKHHFSHEHSRYGVSSPLWDYIMGTSGQKHPKTQTKECL